METLGTRIYRSPNGDQWYLVVDEERSFIRHQPNRASGGQSSQTDIEDFLSEGHGPQHEALLRLLEHPGAKPCL
jgi:hypothetical protein